MARPLRLEFPGAVYHITARGNAREPIFLDEAGLLEFLSILCQTVSRYNWILHAYCLMGNHYHLLLETPDGNLSAGMRQINGVYSQYVNRRYRRAGHLMQGRYRSILVDKDSYLLELCRYIVLNPVRAGLVKSPFKWNWSSYRQTIGQGRGIPCLTTDWLLRQFAGRRHEAVKRYRKFVAEGMGAGVPWEHLEGQMFLGGKRFIDRAMRFMKKKELLKEIPRTQRYAGRPSLERLLGGCENRQDRDRAVGQAYQEYGYTMKEIADHMGVHYVTVSRAIKRFEILS